MTQGTYSPSLGSSQAPCYFFIFLIFYSCFMSMCNLIGYDRHTPCFYIYAWPEAPYLITVFAFSRRNLFVAFGIPLLILNFSFTVQSVS